DELLAGPARRRDAPAQVVDLLLWNLDVERPDAGRGVDGSAHDASLPVRPPSNYHARAVAGQDVWKPRGDRVETPRPGQAREPDFRNAMDRRDVRGADPGLQLPGLPAGGTGAE